MCERKILFGERTMQQSHDVKVCEIRGSEADNMKNTKGIQQTHN